MIRHRRTDPACRHFQQPRSWWARWRYNRARGRSCAYCLYWSTYRTALRDALGGL